MAEMNVTRSLFTPLENLCHLQIVLKVKYWFHSAFNLFDFLTDLSPFEDSLTAVEVTVVSVVSSIMPEASILVLSTGYKYLCKKEIKLQFENRIMALLNHIMPSEYIIYLTLPFDVFSLDASDTQNSRALGISPKT